MKSKKRIEISRHKKIVGLIIVTCSCLLLIIYVFGNHFRSESASPQASSKPPQSENPIPQASSTPPQPENASPQASSTPPQPENPSPQASSKPPQPEGKSCKKRDHSVHHHLSANKDTVHWGYFSRTLTPKLMVQSGDLVTVEAITHHAGDDYERMINGDPGIESIYYWTEDKKNVHRRGAGPMDASIHGRGAGEGFGVHILTGPIGVCGAKPGDILEVRILSFAPRPSRNPKYAGRLFGSNLAAWWGYFFTDHIEEPKKREVVTLFEIKAGRRFQPGKSFATAVYSYKWEPLVDPFGVIHRRYDYPGIVVDHQKVKKRTDVLENVQVPIRPHFGVIGVAPKEADYVDSIPPSYFGGNIDNWRIGPGARLFLPVAVNNALLSMGDPHAAQGDSECSGTAIEMSFTGKIKVVLHTKSSLSGNRKLENLNYPLLESPTEYIVHGFTYENYLETLGPTAQHQIYNESSIDMAYQDATRKMRRFLMQAKGLSEDEAISLMSIGVDFGITQVANGTWGVHGILKKSLFVDE